MFNRSTLKQLSALGLSLLLASCAQLEREPDVQLGTLAVPTHVRMYLASGAANNYLATNAGSKELLKQGCPLQFNGDANPGSLLTLTVSGPSPKACYAIGTQLVGVFTAGENATDQFAINPGETMSVALGSDPVLRGLSAVSASVSVQPTPLPTRFDVRFYDGTKLLGTKRFSPTGSGTSPVVFSLGMSGKPFTRIVLVPVQGSFSLRGGRNVVAFSLSGVREYRYKFEYEYVSSDNYRSGTVQSGCSTEPITVNYYDDADRRIYRSATHIYRGEVIDGGILRLYYLYTAAGEFTETSDVSGVTAYESYSSSYRANAVYPEVVGSPMPQYVPGTISSTTTQYWCGEDRSSEPWSRNEDFDLYGNTGAGYTQEVPLNKLSGVLWQNTGDCSGDYWDICSWTETQKYTVTPK